MSRRLLSRNPDLAQLCDEGYRVEIRGSHLLVHDVPYVNSKREIAYGTLVSTLHLAGEVTQKPETHVAHFIGEVPCDKDGNELKSIISATTPQTLGPGLTVGASFSSKPAEGYPDYHAKMTTYVTILSSQAQAIDPDVTARKYLPIATTEDDSVFQYLDTASSRAGIAALAAKLEGQIIGIIGLGGTGAYVLDLVAKTHVKEIHLFDDDDFLTHNAFRAPGAASLAQLNEKQHKVDYLRGIYSGMHKHIHAHAVRLDETNLPLLEGMTMVFVCIDGGAVKKPIFKKLTELGIPFIDTGMGVELVDEQLLAVLRVTTSTPEKRDHVAGRISFHEGEVEDEYAKNIQIAELNSLSAALAVIRWKKLYGLYRDLEGEHHSCYVTSGNNITNDITNDEAQSDDEAIYPAAA